jgi:hypothetical protein
MLFTPCIATTQLLQCQTNQMLFTPCIATTQLLQCQTNQMLFTACIATQLLQSHNNQMLFTPCIATQLLQCHNNQMLFTPCIATTQLLQCQTNQMYICYNLIPHRILYMFLTLKSHYQEDSCKNTNIMVQYISTCMLYGEPSMCVYYAFGAVLWIGEW